MLTERQMLEALLTQSANDMAYSLALWDAGSLPAFVAKMNALAASLGATRTHYVDASGYDPRLGVDGLRLSCASPPRAWPIPTFAQVVGMTSITLPLVGTVPNIVTEIGHDGVVGVKSGYTSKAGGCMVLAADRVIDGRQVLVLAAVLGQPVPPPPPPTTTTARPRPPRPPGHDDHHHHLAPATTDRDDRPPPPLPRRPPRRSPADLRYPLALHPPGGRAAARRGQGRRGPGHGGRRATGGDGHRRPGAGGPPGGGGGRPGGVAAGLARPAGVVGRHRSGPPGGPRRDTGVGTACYTLGTQVESVPLRLAATVPEPTWWWRLLHN